MHKITAIGLFCSNKFEETPKQKLINQPEFQNVPGLNKILILTINAIWMNFGYVRQNVLITFFINKTYVGQTVFEQTDIWFMK